MSHMEDKGRRRQEIKTAKERLGRSENLHIQSCTELKEKSNVVSQTQQPLQKLVYFFHIPPSHFSFPLSLFYYFFECDTKSTENTASDRAMEMLGIR